MAPLHRVPVDDGSGRGGGPVDAIGSERREDGLAPSLQIDGSRQRRLLVASPSSLADDGDGGLPGIDGDATSPGAAERPRGNPTGFSGERGGFDMGGDTHALSLLPSSFGGGGPITHDVDGLPFIGSRGRVRYRAPAAGLQMSGHGQGDPFGESIPLQHLPRIVEGGGIGHRGAGGDGVERAPHHVREHEGDQPGGSDGLRQAPALHRREVAAYGVHLGDGSSAGQQEVDNPSQFRDLDSVGRLLQQGQIRRRR